MERKLWAIEVKAKSIIKDEDINKLQKSAFLINADKRVIISKTDRPFFAKELISADLQSFLEKFD